MTLRLSRADFTALSRGGGGAAAGRALVLSRRSRTLQLIRIAAGMSRAAHDAFSLLTDLPLAAVHHVADHPRVGDWAIRAATGRTSPGGLVNIVAAAAIIAGRSLSVLVPASEQFVLPSLGTVRRPLSGLVGVDGLDWEPTPRLDVGDGVSFELDLWQAGGQELRVATGVDVPRWRDVLSATWQELCRHHSPVAAELAEVVRVLTPLRPSASGVNSATLADAFGCVFLSLGPDVPTVAVTLAHELQHQKLVVLMDLFALVEPGGEARFYAPWREDPRPLVGLLHGVYAHLGVAGFWRRAGRETDFARWRAAALEAAGTMMESPGLTRLGRDFTAGMMSVLAEWCAEPVAPAALAEANRLAAEHRLRWIARNREPG